MKMKSILPLILVFCIGCSEKDEAQVDCDDIIIDITSLEAE